MNDELNDILSDESWGKPAEGKPRVAAPPSELEDILGDKSWGAAANKTAPAGVTGDTPWSEVLSRGAGNFLGDIPKTAQEIGEGVLGIGHAALHPRKTYENMQNADWGEIGDQLKHDYLTEEGWKQGVAERPVSRLMDVSMLAAGPEALAARGAAKAGYTGLSKGIQIASKAHDPAAWITEAGKFGLNKGTRLANEIVGEATGTGGKSLNLLFDAGLESAEMAKAAGHGLKSGNDPISAVRGFEEALDDFTKEGYAAYRADKTALKRDNQRLSFGDVDAAIAQARKDFVDPFSTNTNPEVIAAITALEAMVNRQRQASIAYDYAQTMAQNRMLGTRGVRRGPNPHLDPIAMDELKKAIGREAANSSGEAKAVFSRVRQAVGDQIKHHAPIYDKMMADYSAMSEAVQAFKSELSLSKSPDAALRKLYSALRNNVTANYGRRWKLVEKLAENPKARKALYNLAGQTNNKWGPRGLVGAFQTKVGVPLGAYAAYAGAVNPWLLPLGLGAQSPRVMGNFALKSGQVGRKLAKVPWRPIAYMGHAAGSPYVGLEGDEE